MRIDQVLKLMVDVDFPFAFFNYIKSTKSLFLQQFSLHIQIVASNDPLKQQIASSKLIYQFNELTTTTSQENL